MGSGKTLHLDSIGCDEAVTLPGLFRRRIEKSPDAIAYKQYEHAEGRWRSYTWREMGAIAGRLGEALSREGLIVGDRVALLLKNSVEWVSFDQAALSLGLVVVSLYTTDNPGNNAYILMYPPQASFTMPCIIYEIVFTKIGA
jgi:long-chain acyl-CoA synthetase